MKNTTVTQNQEMNTQFQNKFEDINSTVIPRSFILACLSNARLEIIDKSSHYVHMDKPEDLVRVVTQFLDDGANRHD